MVAFGKEPGAFNVATVASDNTTTMLRFDRNHRNTSSLPLLLDLHGGDLSWRKGVTYKALWCVSCLYNVDVSFHYAAGSLDGCSAIPDG
jgi:hypothetical protein